MLNINFTTVALCKKVEGGDDTIEVVLSFDANAAEKFFNRFLSNNDITTADGKIKIKFNYSADGNIIGIILVTEEYGTLIVINPKEVHYTVLNGYQKISFLNKVSAMLDFDFEAANDLFNADFDDEEMK